MTTYSIRPISTLRLISAFVLAILLINPMMPALAEIPGATTKTVPLQPEHSVTTYLPSNSAPGQGLVINIIYPEKPRYALGAPIAVVVPGGDTASGLEFNMHATQAGFIELRFAFPGGGPKELRSGGKKDYRGLKSQMALRDILLFAAGKTKDFQGRSIKDLVPQKIVTDNLGIVGWSNGGNIALVTLDKYSDNLPPIRWLAFYESPLGSLFFPPSLGSSDDLFVNKHYREGSAATGRCLIDYRKLAWQGNLIRNPNIHKKRGEPEIPGVVYFDENGNQVWDETTEFAFNYCLDRNLKKQIYPPDVTAALERLQTFDMYNPLPKEDPPDPKTTTNSKDEKEIKVPVVRTTWPSTVATLEESEAYFQERDGSVCIPSICSKYPDLLVSIFGSHMDHLQRQLDHPHIVLQYNAWLDNGIHWVRLNPEPIYIAQMSNMNWRNFTANKPNMAIDATQIADHLEPEGVLLDYVFMEAAIAELADRFKSKNLKSPLEAPIVTYSTGLAVQPANQNSAKKDSPDKDKSN